MIQVGNCMFVTIWNSFRAGRIFRKDRLGVCVEDFSIATSRQQAAAIQGDVLAVGGGVLGNFQVDVIRFCQCF